MKTPACRPYSRPFTSVTTASTESNGSMETTGPKISSVSTRAPAGTEVSTVGQ